MYGAVSDSYVAAFQPSDANYPRVQTQGCPALPAFSPHSYQCTLLQYSVPSTSPVNAKPYVIIVIIINHGGASHALIIKLLLFLLSRTRVLLIYSVESVSVSWCRYSLPERLTSLLAIPSFADKSRTTT
ncbi:hypothetical protein MPTK2_1g19510 [Marchantia polymorpha subsp. ruderalis]